MNANVFINHAIRHFGLDTGPWRTDDGATTRIASFANGTLYISDHMQGRGQRVTIRQATKLDVAITTRRHSVKAENVAPENLVEVIEGLIDELRRM